MSDENGGRFGSVVSVGVGDSSSGLGLLCGCLGFLLDGTLLAFLCGSFSHLLVLIIGRVGGVGGRVGRVLLGGSDRGGGGGGLSFERENELKVSFRKFPTEMCIRNETYLLVIRVIRRVGRVRVGSGSLLDSLCDFSNLLLSVGDNS